MAQHAAEMRCDQPIRDDEEDKGWVPAGGREPADYSGDEDDQEEPAVPAFTASGAASSDDKNSARMGGTVQLKTPNDEGEESDDYEVVRGFVDAWWLWSHAYGTQREDEDEEMDSNSDDDSGEEGEEVSRGS